MKLNPVLHPKRKMRYFKKNWSGELQEEVLKMAETIVSPLTHIFLLNLTKVVSLQTVTNKYIREIP